MSTYIVESTLKGPKGGLFIGNLNIVFGSLGASTVMYTTPLPWISFK